MGAGGCGGERSTHATFPREESGRQIDTTASTISGFDCPGGQRYLASAGRRKLFTHSKITSTLDSVFGSTEVQINGGGLYGDRARFGGQCGIHIDVGHDDEEEMRKLHNQVSSRVEYLGKTVWR